jgi:hypothetical protein
MHVVAALCHGRGRHPDEPYGITAPLVRCVAWSLVAVGAVLCALGIVLFEAHWHGSALAMHAGVWAASLGVVCRLGAMTLHPGSAILPRRTP